MSVSSSFLVKCLGRCKFALSAQNQNALHIYVTHYMYVLQCAMMVLKVIQ